LAITEIMYDPSAVVDTKGEWLELYNPGPGTVDLRGLTLQDAADSHVIAAAEPLSVGAGEYVVLARNGSVAQNGGVEPIHVYGKLTLNNPGETLTLSYNGTLIDQVVYGEAEGTPEAKGASLMLFSLGPPSNIANDNSFDWCVSTGSFGSGDKGHLENPTGIAPTRGEEQSNEGNAAPRITKHKERKAQFDVLRIWDISRGGDVCLFPGPERRNSRRSSQSHLSH
jgi:hypothetical protein